MDEVRLIRSAQRGSAEAFEQLALRYQQVLAASARYTVGNQDDAEDAVQDTLVRAYRHLPSLKDPDKFRAWLFSILRHVCLTLLQKRAPAAGSLEDYAETLAAPEPPDDHAIAGALEQLPPAYREVLIAHYMQGLSYAEMAEVFNITEEALRARCLRARETLRKLIGEAEEKETRRYMRRALALVPLAGDFLKDRVLEEISAMEQVNTLPFSPDAEPVLPGAAAGIPLFAIFSGWKFFTAAGIVAVLALAGIVVHIATRAPATTGNNTTKDPVVVTKEPDIIKEQDVDVRKEQNVTKKQDAITKAPDVIKALDVIDVAISEFCPLPVNNAPTWIELFNYGKTPVDAGGWILCDKTGVIYTIPHELPAIPAQGLVLVTFSGKDSPETDEMVFAEGKTAKLYTRNDNSLNAIRGFDNECALYASSTPEPDMILDHACWGSWPDSPYKKAAVAIGLTTRMIADDDVKAATIPPTIPVIVSSCGFARKLFEKPKFSRNRQLFISSPCELWDVYPLRYLTPGKDNIWLPPIPHGPRGNAYWDEKNGIGFGLFNPGSQMPRKGRPNWEVRLQVSSNVNFTELLVDEFIEPLYHLKPPPDPGTYYWRLRYETKEEETVWTESIKFTVVKMTWSEPYKPTRK